MGSSGSSSGKVDYPAYLKIMHTVMLMTDEAPDITPSLRVDQLIKLSVNPYESLEPFVPNGIGFPSTQNIQSAITDLETYVAEIPVSNWTLDIWDTVYLKLGELWDVADAEVFTPTAASNIEGLELTHPFTAAFNINFMEYDFDFTAADKMEELQIYYQIDEQMDAFADKLDSRINATVYPRFERGMQSIGAVNSSAFPIGRALVEAAALREVAEYGAALKREAYLLQKNKQMDAYMQEDQISQGVVAQHLTQRGEAYLQEDRLRQQDKDKIEDAYLQADQIRGTVVNTLNQSRPALAGGRASSLLAGSEQILRLINSELQLRANMHQALSQMEIEGNRIGIVAMREYHNDEAEYGDAEGKWHMNMQIMGANVLAGIAGASTVSSGGGPGKVQSAIGGAFSGAAAGAMLGAPTGIGAPVGAAIGGIVGLAGGLL